MKLTVDYIKYNLDIEITYDTWEGEDWRIAAIPEENNRKVREAYGPTFDRAISKLIETIKDSSWEEG